MNCSQTSIQKTGLLVFGRYTQPAGRELLAESGKTRSYSCTVSLVSRLGTWHTTLTQVSLRLILAYVVIRINLLDPMEWYIYTRGQPDRGGKRSPKGSEEFFYKDPSTSKAVYTIGLCCGICLTSFIESKLHLVICCANIMWYLSRLTTKSGES